MAVSFVPFLGNHGELAHLPAIQSAIGDRDAEHVGMQLEVKAVLET